ncbi:hypothetical protein COTS27_00328 [Spirochaetota bacterium]|nr:hypothetical protein COTS27_00328 [Spirochaetota bacterium]
MEKKLPHFSIAPPFPSVGARLVAFLIDLFIIIILGQLFRQGYFGSFLRSLSIQISLLVVSLFYVISSYWMLSSTYGKIILGMRIVDETGRKMRPKQGLLRILWIIIGALPVFLGYFYATIDPRRQSFHDKMAQTIVIFDES